MWSRQVYRLSDLDFNANKTDGHGIDWPIRYEDIEPWYQKVETFIGIAGSAEGLPQLPDSVFQPAFELTDAEKALKAKHWRLSLTCSSLTCSTRQGRLRCMCS